MPDTSSYQSWCDAHAFADSVMAGAYEALRDIDRAALKKCIARQHVMWGEYAACDRRTRAFRQGFSLEEDETPAAYALLVCEAPYPSAAAFVAALMPPLLAGVSAVVSCFISAKDQYPIQDLDQKSGQNSAQQGVSAPLLGALELVGVERAFAASEAEVCALAELLHMDHGSGGRIVLLGGPGFAESLILQAHRSGVRCRSLRLEDDADATELRRDATHLDAANQDVWFWPDLGPEWFRNRRMRIFSPG